MKPTPTWAENNSNSSTSPSLFLGTKSDGNSKSNTNSVFGNSPCSFSKKNLKEGNQSEKITSAQGFGSKQTEKKIVSVSITNKIK